MTVTDNERQWVDIFIWSYLVTPACEKWVKHIFGALKDFRRDGSFKFVNLSGDRSGSAISFQCQVSPDPELFDLGVSGCNDAIIPAIRKTKYLSLNVSSMGLHYTHLTEDKSGMVTRAMFEQNAITNATDDFITFHSTDMSRVLLNLQPEDAKQLTGPVN